MTTTSTDTPAVELTREFAERELTHALTVAAATGDDEIRNIWLGRAALCRSWLARQDEARTLAANYGGSFCATEENEADGVSVNLYYSTNAAALKAHAVIVSIIDAALSKETK